MPNTFTIRKIAMGLESPRQVMVLNSIDAIAHLNFPLKLKTLISIVCIGGELTITVDLVEHTLTSSSIMVVRPMSGTWILRGDCTLTIQFL